MIVALTLVPLGWEFAEARSLSLEDRIAAQRAIEQVYWQHRIWPAANCRPKPALHAVLPEEAIRAEVENYLEESNALAGLWGRPITTEQLQNEMDRMIAHTKDAKVLQEIFDALGNDPFLIAETLARQTLSDRLIREAYDGKTIFDKFWSDERGTFGVDIEEASGPYTLATFAAPTLAGCVNDSWSPTYFTGPDPRKLATAVWTGSEMIVWGGNDNNGSVATGGRYNPATDTWLPTSLGANVPPAREDHTAIWTGTEMIVWGGRSHVQFNPGPPMNSGGRYNPTTDGWAATSTGSNVPTARFKHTAVWTGTEMIVWGGAISNGAGANTGGRYSPSTDTWLSTSTGANTPQARDWHTAVWTGTEMIVWGGEATVDGTPLGTGGRYSPATDTWLATSTAGAPSARTGHTAVWTGAKMIVWGGDWWSERFNNGGRYDPSTDTWSATSTGAGVPSVRAHHTAVWTGSEMVMWGGDEWSVVSDGDLSLNTGGRYDPIADQWVATSTGTAVPARRGFHVAVWTGAEMIVWSGEENGFSSPTLVPSGGRYSPATNSWKPMVLNVPEARNGPRAVWTGSEMIVWGGTGGSQNVPLNTGGRYVPATDSWTFTSAGANAPQARSGHTAVWTGTEMIVWGGRGAAAFKTGARYSPQTDTWLPTSTGPNVPAARRSHSAVWTGTEMIVWGGHGQSSGQFLNSGGRYDPLTNVWTATSASSVPTGRMLHGAVWTGSEMVVWGGQVAELGTVTNTGGRYSPASDTWVATPSVSAPSARYDHATVWTGTEMIVWSGSGSGVTNTGGRYNPVSDVWAPTSIGANAPAVHIRPAAVWTGAKMIVWGGAGDGGQTATGGSYDPVANTWLPVSMVNVPAGRDGLAAVWTGSEMVVWGGYGAGFAFFNSGGRYCSCAPATYFRDADGDGFGDPTDTVSTCGAPSGYVATAGDCDDANASRRPGATEACNGVDDDCDTIADNGVPPPPEIGGVSVSGQGPTTLSWTGLGTAASYDLATSTLEDLSANATATATCLAGGVPAASYVDEQPDPAENTGYYYIVRARDSCGTGSYGFDSVGEERIPTAPCP